MPLDDRAKLPPHMPQLVSTGAWLPVLVGVCTVRCWGFEISWEELFQCSSVSVLCCCLDMHPSSFALQQQQQQQPQAVGPGSRTMPQQQYTHAPKVMRHQQLKQAGAGYTNHYSPKHANNRESRCVGVQGAPMAALADGRAGGPLFQECL